MKLAVTKKYVEELQEKYCDPTKHYIPGYGINRQFFTFFSPQPRVMFFNEEEIIVLKLSRMTLNVTQEQVFPITATTKLIFKKGIMMNKFKIVESGKVVYKTLINKAIIGFKDMQKNCNQFLASISNK